MVHRVRCRLCFKHQKCEWISRSQGHLCRQAHDQCRFAQSQYPALYTSVSWSTNVCPSQSLFQCLIGSCPQDTYGPAVAHVVLACSDLGLSIGPLHPVQVQHVDLQKPSYLPTPALPAAYGTPSDPFEQNTEHVTLSFDISLDVKCNSGPDGLVTVSLPPPAPTPSSAPPSPPVPDPENGEGESENGDGNGDGNGNGSDNDNSGGNDDEKPTVSSSPAEQTSTMPDPADPSATSSCPPNSAPSSVQDPSDGQDGQAPPQSSELGEHGDPAVTSAPSQTPPNGDNDPNSLPSQSPCSTASEATGSSDPEKPKDLSHSNPSPSPTQEASDLPTDGDKPEVSATSDVEGMPAPAPTPAPAPPSPAPASSPCSTTNGADISVDPILGSQVPQTAEPTSVAQASSLPCSSPSLAPTSLMEPEPISTIHPMPLPLPVPSLPSYQTADESNVTPPEYTPSGLSGQSPNEENSGSETSPSESNAEPLPQENHSTKVDEPSSYGQDSRVPPVPVPVPASQTGTLAVQNADGKPTGKPTEPSVPTAKRNQTSCITGSARGGGSPTTSCKSDVKQTTVHPPRSNLPLLAGMVKDVLATGDVRKNVPLGSIMVKIIQSDDHGDERMLTALWENAPPATTLSRGIMESMESMESKENDQASATQLGIGSSPTAESTANTGHRDVVSSTFVAHAGFATSESKPNASSIQLNSTAMGSSPLRAALTNSDSKSTPYLYMMTLLVMLTTWALMG